MSKLNELIAQLCPDGVAFKELEEVASLTMGVSPKGNTISDDPSAGIEFHQGKTFFGDMVLRPSNIYTSTPIKIALAHSVIMSVRAPVGDSNITNRKIAIGRGLCSIMGKDGLDTKYLHHFLNFNIYELKKKASVGTFESINTNEIKSIRIPVPPLPVQVEIVRILDAFTKRTTELIALLTKEIAARKKQFEYYRDKLLTFGDEVKWKTLGEICKKIISGGTPKSNNPDYYNGNIPWLRTQEVDWKDIYDTDLKITQEGYDNASVHLIPINCVIVAMYGATAAKVAINKIPLTTNQACCNLEVDDTIADYRYVFHWLGKEYLNLKALGRGSQSNINAGMIKDYPIPVPPLPVQREIVRILDAFTENSTALIGGLSAEITARKKQYEYYRDKLLAFKEVEGG